MSGEVDIKKIFGAALDGSSASPEPGSVVPGEVGAPLSVADAAGVTRSDVDTVSMSRLATDVVSTFRVNYNHRRTSGVDNRLRYCLSSQTCTYNDKQRELLERIGIDRRIYSPITATKVRAAKSMLVELAQYGSDIPFSVMPTPDPDVPDEIAVEVLQKQIMEIMSVMEGLQQRGVQELPPDVMARLQELIKKTTDASFDEAENEKDSFARKRAKRLERKVWDTMVQGDFDRQLMKCIDYVCTYGTCVMVGPVKRNEAHNKTTKDGRSGVRRIKRVIGPVQKFEALNPVDCYPAPDAVDITDGAFCVRVKYTHEQLWRFKKSSADDRKQKGADGWRDNAVTFLLDMFSSGCRLDEFPKDQDVRMMENNATDSSDDCKFEGIRCFSYVHGAKLLEIGITRSMDGIKIELDGYYHCETIVIGGMVVYCRIHDDRIGSPLSKAVFYELPGSWWGESIADKLFATQSIMNNAIVSLLRNMGPASSSMMWINDVSRLVDKSPNGLKADPGKIFAFGSSFTGQTQAGAPMGILQIPSNASELLAVAKWASAQADLDSGIPAFSEGTGGSNGGALRTAEGLRTYTEATSRGLKMIVMFLDNGIIRDSAKRTANHILVFDDDMELKGDVEVHAVGLMGKVLKAQNDQARIQLFNLCLNSQFMTNVLGVKGILELFRPSCRDINVNPDNVCPSDDRVKMMEELEQFKQMFAAFQGQQGGEGPQSNGGGTDQGIAPVANVGGGVAGRRSVA